VEINDCAKEKIPDKYRMCMAEATVSINHCDYLSNINLKERCTQIVRDRQRRLVWDYQKKHNK
jgi:hypothetical protein